MCLAKMADDVVVFHRKDLPLEAFPLMEEIRRRGKLCDVTLKVGDQKFSGHRIVLAASIPYFHAMFTHDMVESKQEEITMQGIEPGALEALINYAYNGKIQIDTTSVQSLLVGACFLHLHIIKEACCDFLRNRLHPNNVLGVRSFADQFMCGGLVDACNSYIQKQFVEVMMSDEFLALPAEEVSSIISQDELCVESEEVVFEAVMRWVKANESANTEHLPTLLCQVRLPLLSPMYLADVVSQEELIKTSLKCRDLIDEAKDYHLIPERRNQLQTFRNMPRCHSGVIGLIYAVGGLTSSGDSISTVEYYDPIVDRWHVDKPMKTFRSRVGIAVLKDDMYAIGGYDGRERLNTVEVFNIGTKEWNLVSPMLCCRSALGAAALDDKLYVCGGYDGVSSLNSVECYNPALDKWTMETSMLKHRSAAGVAVFDRHVYCLGGHDGLSIFDSVERYNVITSQWSMMAPMLTKRCRLGVAALDGKLYAAGGYDGNVFLKSVERYDPITNKWSYVAPMNIKRSRVALVANCGKLYAIGGYDGASNLNTVEVYDLKENKWSFAAHMQAHEGGVGVGILPLESLDET